MLDQTKRSPFVGRPPANLTEAELQGFGTRFVIIAPFGGHTFLIDHSAVATTRSLDFHNYIVNEECCS
jgi:hypothetical protein